MLTIIIKNIKEYYLEILALFYILVNTTRISRFWIENTSYFNVDEVSGNFLVSVMGLLCLLLIAIKRENIKTIFCLKNKKLLWCLFLYTLVSISWSLLPYISFRRWIKIFTLVFVTIYIQKDQKIFFKILLWYFSIVTFSSLFLIVFIPKYGFMDYYGQLLPQGIMGHKNFLGLFSAIALIVLPFLYQNLKSNVGLIKTLLIINFIFVVVSSSRTAQTALIIAYLFSGFLMILIKNKFFLFSALSSLLMLFISISILNIDLLGLYEGLIYSMGKDLSYTGRVELWQALIALTISYRPLIGFGFKSVFVGSASSWLSNYLSWEAPTAHSDYITIYTELGLIGIILMILFLLSSYYKSIIEFKSNKSVFYLITLLNFYLVESITEVHFMNTTILFVFLIIAKTYQNTSTHNTNLIKKEQ